MAEAGRIKGGLVTSESGGNFYFTKEEVYIVVKTNPYSNDWPHKISKSN